MGDSISALPEMFILIILKGILNLNINIDLNIGVSDSSLGKLASQLKLSITYFECEGGSVIKSKEYKGGKNEIKIGYLVSDDKYGCFEKLPESK